MEVCSMDVHFLTNIFIWIQSVVMSIMLPMDRQILLTDKQHFITQFL